MKDRSLTLGPASKAFLDAFASSSFRVRCNLRPESFYRSFAHDLILRLDPRWVRWIEKSEILMEISTPETKVILIDAYGSETELPLEEAIYELSWLGEGIIWISPKLAFYRAEGAPRSDEYLLSRDPRLLKRFEK